MLPNCFFSKGGETTIGDQLPAVACNEVHVLFDGWMMAGGDCAGVWFTLDGYRCSLKITSSTQKRDGMFTRDVSSNAVVPPTFSR